MVRHPSLHPWLSSLSRPYSTTSHPPVTPLCPLYASPYLINLIHLRPPHCAAPRRARWPSARATTRCTPGTHSSHPHSTAPPPPPCHTGAAGRRRGSGGNGSGGCNGWPANDVGPHPSLDTKKGRGKGRGSDQRGASIGYSPIATFQMVEHWNVTIHDIPTTVPANPNSAMMTITPAVTETSAAITTARARDRPNDCTYTIVQEDGDERG